MSIFRRREMHVNSLDAWWRGQAELFSKREALVLGALGKFGRASDREVMLNLGFADMNSVRPRITELIRDGVIEEVGTIEDPVTLKTVRVVALRGDPRTPVRQFEFSLQPQ